MDYSIKINEFEGPLDLLLHLIKKANINIYDISISEITNQYLEYIDKMQELNINVASSYLVMACELMEIKSKLLLPNEKEENEQPEEDLKQNLINKLIEYQKYKEIVPKFRELETKRQEIYTKLPENIYNYIDNTNEDIKSDINSLIEAFNNFLERQKYIKPLNTKVTNKEYSVKERTKEIKEILKVKKKIKFTDLFDNCKKDYIIVTFLSILEMAKESTIIIKQEHNFEEIYLQLAKEL